MVVDVSNSPSFEAAAVLKFFETSTRNLLDAEAAAGVGHHVALSVVGTETPLRERLLLLACRWSDDPCHDTRRCQVVAINGAIIQPLAANFGGELIQPQEAGYDSRQIWNGNVQRRPALIARCRGTADVMAAVRFCREHDLPRRCRAAGTPWLAMRSVTAGSSSTCPP